MGTKMPSLAALLGLVAIAGYQNREKIGEFVKGLSKSDPNAPGGVIDNVKKTLGDGPIATKVTAGLGEMVDQFKKSGLGDKVDSWVGKGENAPITQPQMETALGGDLIDDLVKQTGLSRAELIERLTKILPAAVDKLTPEGRVPA